MREGEQRERTVDRRKHHGPSAMEQIGWLREGKMQGSSELIVLGQRVLLTETGEKRIGNTKSWKDLRGGRGFLFSSHK